MGTHIYGQYDELVLELRGVARVRAGRGSVRVSVDDVWRVRSADPRTLVSRAGERVLRTPGRRGALVLVLDLVGGAPYDRIVLGLPDAARVAADLHRSGIGGGAREYALVS